MAYIEDATKTNKLKPSSSAVQKPETPTYTHPKYETPITPQPAAPQVDYAGMIADALREQQEAAARKLQAQIKQGVNTLESQRPELQQQYDQAAQSAYVQNMLSKRDLPQAMAASGYTGGLHESSLVDLDNTYGNNLNALKTGYNSSVNALDRDIANLKATGNISIAENANNYAQLIAEAAREAQAAQLAAQTKYAGGSGGGYDEKPRLTLAQARELLESGYDAPDALSAFKYYSGTDYSPQLSSEGAEFATAMARNLKNYQFADAVGPEGVKELIAKAIQSQLSSGRLTRRDAIMLAQQYGIEIG